MLKCLFLYWHIIHLLLKRGLEKFCLQEDLIKHNIVPPNFIRPPIFLWHLFHMRFSLLAHHVTLFFNTFTSIFYFYSRNSCFLQTSLFWSKNSFFPLSLWLFAQMWSMSCQMGQLGILTALIYGDLTLTFRKMMVKDYYYYYCYI